MTRIHAITVTLAVLALACGSSEDPRSSAAFPSGRVLGTAFAPVEATANVGAPADCGGAFVSKVLLGFFSDPDVCTMLPDACHSKANGTGVLVLLERIGDSARPAFVPGIYPVGATSETGGQLLVFARVARTDASCGVTASSTALTGTVTIDAIDTTVQGHLDLAFPNGERFGGAFEAPLCSETYDTCNGDACAGASVCVP